MVVLFVLAVVLVVGAWLVHGWVNELARVRVHEGKATLASGALPGGILASIGNSARLSGFANGDVVIHRGGTVRTTPRDEGLEQRIRNVVGTTTLGKLHTKGDHWVDAANRTAGWMALNAALAGLFRRFR
jgi:hypothetical protein